MQNSLRVLKLLRVLSDNVLLRFLSDWEIFRFLSDRVLFAVLSDRVLIESSVIDYSKGSSVIDSSLRLAVLFFEYAGAFLSKGATPFFIENRCSVLLYIFKKTFTLLHVYTFTIYCSYTLHILFHSETKITFFYLLWFAFIRCITRCITCCITRCITRCHSLSFVVCLRDLRILCYNRITKTHVFSRKQVLW